MVDTANNPPIHPSIPPVVMIAAYAKHRVLGDRGKIPWHIAEDLHRFRQLTIGNVVIMGRKTWDSINQTVLPGRLNIIVSESIPATELPVSISFEVPIYVAYPNAALRVAKQAIAAGWKSTNPKICIIGGAQLYQTMLDRVATLYLTEIDLEFTGDVFFPAVDLRWWRQMAIEQHTNYRFITYQRRKKEDLFGLDR